MFIHTGRAVQSCPCVHSASRASHVVARCEPSNKPAARKDVPLEGEINEDVLAKLRAFEEENKKLKEQLSGSDMPDTEQPRSKGPKVRVDGVGMKREGFMFGGGKSSEGSWLSESDVDFFTSGGSGQDKGKTGEPEEEAIVRRRLLISTGITVGVVLLTLIPTELLDGSASKPLYEYLVPLLRSIALLDDLAVEVENGNTESVGLAVERILNRPNNVRKNLYSAIEYIDSGKRQPAREVVGNFVDLVQQADYNKYFDSVGPQSSAQMATYSEFSLKSIRAASAEGRNILRMFPYDAINDARDVLTQY